MKKYKENVKKQTVKKQQHTPLRQFVNFKVYLP